MDWQTFTSSLVETLAWPVAVLLIVIVALFRKPVWDLVENLRRRLVRVKASGGGAFSRSLLTLMCIFQAR